MGNAEETSKQQAEETNPGEKPARCLICAKEGPALLYGHWICDRCKVLVQAEALAQQRRIIKEGGGPA